MVVVGRERRADDVTVEQLAGHARILTGNQIGACQCRERTQGNIAEVADGGRHDMQTGRDLADIEGMAAEGVLA